MPLARERINIDANEHRITISGGEVVLTPPTPEVKIADSEWLIMNARDFSTENEARPFGTKLKAALEISAVAARVGVDAGRDFATSGLGQTIRDQILKSTGADVRNNIHGLDVFPDNPNTRVFNLSATGTVRASAEPFLSDLNELVESAAAGIVNLTWMAHGGPWSVPPIGVQQLRVTWCQTANERVLSTRWWAALNK